MALFRLGPANEPANFIRGEGGYLRPPPPQGFDAPAVSAGAPRVARPGEDGPRRHPARAPLGGVAARRRPLPHGRPGAQQRHGHSGRVYRRRLRRQAEEMERDEAFPFFVFRSSDHTLLGGLTLGQIRRGVSQTGTLGYWMGEAYAGQGYMSRAVRATLVWAFATLRLHRIEAACLPHNDRSIRLLERCGFKREGYARAYLRINGAWQDHVLFAILDSDPLPEGPETTIETNSTGRTGKLAQLFAKGYQSH